MNNAADSDHRGYLEFADFMSFFESNLLNLEREKRIRLLQSSMQSNKRTGNDVQEGGNLGKDENETDIDRSEQSLMDRLLSIFRLSDRENTGFISYDEFTDIMHNFSVHSSNFLMDVLLSELRMNDNGMVDYMKSITTCADLLKVLE
jgi:Ca2+-binding EF-hand superfamily protein